MQTEAYRPSSYTVAGSSSQLRAAFIRRTYAHLAGAILAFIFLEFALFQTDVPRLMIGLLGTSRFSWLIVLAAFMGVSWLAQSMAHSNASVSTQYLGLGLYVVAEALIFIPLLLVAASMSDRTLIPAAGVITALLFVGLTFTAFTTRSDFSFLGGILKIGGFVALGVIAASALFGFSLGLLFSSIMVVFAGGAVLYSTASVLHRYGPNQHVAAALDLFASVALLFWYVLRILMSLGRRG